MLEERNVKRNASSYCKELISKFLCLIMCTCEIFQLILWPYFMYTHIHTHTVTPNT